MAQTPHVFLSYARPDATAASELANALREQGYDVWLDVERLLPGDDWNQAIRNALVSSSYCILLLSPNSVQDGRYVTDEFTLAMAFSEGRLAGDRFGIPVRIAPVEIHDKRLGRLQRLGQFQYVDLFTDREAGLRRLMAAMPEPDSSHEKRRPVLAAFLGAALPLVAFTLFRVARSWLTKGSLAMTGFGTWAGGAMMIAIVSIWLVLRIANRLSSKKQAFIAGAVASAGILGVLILIALQR